MTTIPARRRLSALARPRRLRGLRVQHAVFGALVLIIAGLVVGPVVKLFETSFQQQTSDGVPNGTGFGNYSQAFGASDTWRLLLNTLEYAAGAVALGLVFATAIAWLTERTDLPFRGVIRTLMFATMAVPALVLAFGWVLLLNPNNGAANVWFADIFDTDNGPFTAYSLQMMIIVTGLSFTPTMFVMLSGVMRNMDDRLESAGSVSGAGRWAVLRYVTFPLVRPGILSVAVYVFMIGLQAIETPLAIGLTAGVPVLSTRIFLLASPENNTPNYGFASAFGVVLLAFAAVLMVVYYRTTRRSEKFSVVTGKGFRPRRTALKRMRIPALIFVAGYFALMLLPVLMLAWTSLLPFYQVPSAESVHNLSLGKYRDVIDNPVVREAAQNTVLVVLITATSTMLLASLVSWLAVRGRIRGAKLLEGFAFSPIAVPQIVLATALLALYLRTPLYGSIYLIIIGFVAVDLPFATRAMSAVFLQVNEELERAAIVSGASWFGTFRRVMLPLLLPQLLDGWLWVAANSIRQLTLALTLFTGANLLIAPQMWEMWNYPDLSGASALGILMILASMVLILPIQVHRQWLETRAARRARRLSGRLEAPEAGSGGAHTAVGSAVP